MLRYLAHAAIAGATIPSIIAAQESFVPYDEVRAENPGLTQECIAQDGDTCLGLVEHRGSVARPDLRLVFAYSAEPRIVIRLDVPAVTRDGQLCMDMRRADLRVVSDLPPSLARDIDAAACRAAIGEVEGWSCVAYYRNPEGGYFQYTTDNGEPSAPFDRALDRSVFVESRPQIRALIDEPGF
ncbi:hypothetical protein [Pelagovum pacificum]|uniref:Uncharacterized protein n=1 Tax=Pelagovum pacificum TaxID=2588711 RepID=A0A5C5GFM0_9RHOB|nr:hypothetical protein [Pelagovum pacificum]QQA43301.1 hypothetical protein I8N54_01645 [Pelagovum pacificum]TNY33562.1 hypothetical protein FHY64_09880 [Pelagovum pacificum]